ncbi:MAG: YfhO family protein [Acidobacteriota bacterium]
MGALLSAFFYAALAGILLLVARWLGLSPSKSSAAILILLPLAFTASGWVPGKTLAPTASLATVPPWTHPDLASAMTSGGDPPHPLLLDPLSQMLPWRQAARSHWGLNPSQDSGAALLGNAQSAVLFPLEILARQLPPSRAVTFTQTSRLLLAVLGLFLLARALGAGDRAALLGATAYGGAGFLHLWRLHPHSYVAALAPWILLAALFLARRPGPRSTAGLALLGALGVTAGHPETLLHVVLLAIAVCLPTLWRRQGWSRRIRRTLLWGSASALLAALLAAPALLPFLIQLEVSKEAALRDQAPPLQVVTENEERWQRLAPTLDPFVLGDPRTADWRGPENLTELAGGALAPLAWALALASLARRRQRAQSLPWLLLGALGLGIAVGTPGLADAASATPLLADSLLKRLTLWWALGCSVAAALGAHCLLSSRPGSSDFSELSALDAASSNAVSSSAREVTLSAQDSPESRPGELQRGAFSPRTLALAGLAFAALLPWLLEARLPIAEIGNDHPQRLLITLGTLALATFALWISGRRKRLGAGLLLLGLLIPQIHAFARYIPLAPTQSFYPSTPSLDFLRAGLQPGDRIVGLNSALTPHAAAFFDLEDIRGYDPMTFAPYYQFVSAFAEPQRNRWPNVLVWSHPALSYLGVRYILDHPTMYVFHHPEVLKVYEGEDGLLYENPNPLPRLFLPRQVEVFESADQALAHAQGNPDFAQTAAAAPPPTNLGSRFLRWLAPPSTDTPSLPPPAQYPNGEGVIEDLQVEPGLIRATLRTEGLALATTSQPAIPGWSCWVNGQRAPLVRVNGAFLGVLLTPGDHQVEMRYTIPAWRTSLLLAGCGLLLLIFLLLPSHFRNPL